MAFYCGSKKISIHPLWFDNYMTCVSFRVMRRRGHVTADLAAVTVLSDQVADQSSVSLIYDIFLRNHTRYKCAVEAGKATQVINLYTTRFFLAEH